MHPQLIALIQQNRMQEAKTLCAQLCKAQPNNAQAQFMMSAICGQLGDFAGSEKYVEKAIKLEPTVPEAHFNLGIARLRLNKTDAAIRSFQRALELRPNFPEASNELGNAWQYANDLSRAVAYYRQSLALRPQYADALSNLGTALLKLNQADEAIAQLQAALAANPQLVAAHLALGEHLAAGDKDTALKHCRAALALPVPDAESLSRLALLCKHLGQFEACIDCNYKALQLQPKNARLHTNLGVALKEIGRQEEAIAAHRQAIAHDPKLAEAHYNLGSALTAANREQEAEIAYKKAIALNPAFTAALTNLGTLQLLQGRVGEGLIHLEQALQHSPDYLLAASNRLLALNYTSALSAAEVFAAHRDWGKGFTKNLTPLVISPPMRTATSPLRIGFVSPDFRNHSVAFYFETLLDHGDSSIEIHCYSNSRQRDATTARIRARADGWRDITTLSDSEAATLIQGDRIDVLIDLAGHTSDHRLGIFALRPSPVQITYLGYPNTTGLSAIDFRITDAIADPAGADAFYTERLLRLERCFLCYTPPENAPQIVPPGAAPNQPITFGSFNNLAKITPDMIRIWSEILQRVPGSVLMIKNRPLGDPAVATRFRALFAAQGIGPERLELLSWIPGIDSHLEVYNRVDIALDTYPYHGATTTCEALWMGRPVVTQTGPVHAARVGTSLLNSLGLSELVADDDQAYINIAVRLAEDIHGFNTRYGDLRMRMQHSPLCDRQDFQRRFFALIREVAQHITPTH